ncbi:MAG: DUF255 domain-containing protein [Proteobacteria bacterium]|nr:DUF255 domain-containing protein [Pseudomonadota bacterium]
MEPEKQKPNRLINETSPYLLQHAYNPVEWYPWGEEAFAKARKENKPILLSIGYSTCYWCHVMERETFENEAIAKLMNDSIISIKIDREQRPDVDEIYMTATQLMTQSGGWPNNVFVTPDLKPFFAGTYFSPEDTSYRPGFATLIKHIHEEWTKNPEAIKEQAERVRAAIVSFKQGESHQVATALPDQNTVQTLLDHFRNNYDSHLGGFYQAPKFPNEDALLFLLAAYRMNNDARALEMAQFTLTKMAEGGIYDQVGGGFHRYSTDAEWRIPHFEKMLYNQALLGRAYTELYSFSNAPLDRGIAASTFDFVLRDMTHPEGGLYSALDAETDGAEGASYAWTEAELQKILDQKSYVWLSRYYGLADIPHIPGHKNTDGKILYLKQPVAKIAAAEKVSSEQVLARMQPIMDTLRKARDKRQQPRLDDKIITAWNGLMIDSLARAGMELKEEKYTEAAKKAADFVLAHLRTPDGELLRMWRGGKAQTPAFFEDYSFLIQGLVSTYHATKDGRYLAEAEKLAQKAKEIFWDKEGGGYFYTDGNEALLVRMKNAEDSAIPSGNAIMAQVLLDLYELTGKAEWKQQAEDMLKAFGMAIEANPRSYTHLVHALLRLDHAAPVADTTSMQNVAVAADKDAMSTMTWVKVSVPENAVKRNTDQLRVTAELDVAPGWHVNANPASLDFLVSTSADLREDSGALVIKAVHYPEATAMTTPLGHIKIYEGKILISIEARAPKDAKNLRLLVRAQACKDTTCLAPSDWVIKLPGS